MDETQPKLECPHCHKDIYPQFGTFIPEKQTVHLKLTSSTGAWSAKTIGGVITEFNKLMNMTAKDIGGKVHVFIDTIERSDKELDIGFLITSVTDR